MHPSTNFKLATGAGVTALGMGLLTPVLPSYAEALGANATLLGLFLASFGATRLLASLPTSWAANRIGFRPLLVGSPLTIAVISVLCALTGSFWSLALLCIVEGGAATVYSTAATAALLARTDKPARPLALYQAAGLLGTTTGPVLGGLIAQQFGLRAPFVAYAVLSGLVAWWLYLSLRDQFGLSPRQPSLTNNPKSLTSWLTWRLLIAPRLLPLWLLGFALVFSRIGAQLLIIPLLGAWRFRLSAFETGLLLSLIGLVGLLTLYPTGWLIDYCKPRVVILGGGLVMALALVLLARAESYIVLLLGVTLFGTGISLAGPAPLAYLAAVTRQSERTIGVGLYRTTGEVGAVLAPLLLGWAIDWASYSVALLISASLLMITLGVFCWFAFSNGFKSEKVSHL